MNKRTAHLDAQQLALAFEFDSTPAAPVSPALPACPADRPGPPRAADRQRRVLLGTELHTYRLRRARRRTIGFQIDDRGLTVSAPRWVPLREVEAAIVEKERWIRGKLAEWREWKARRRLAEVRWTDGGQVPHLGAALTLRLAASAGTTQLRLTAAGRELHLALPPDADQTQVRDAVQAWLQAEARRVLGERLAALAERIDVKPRAWTLSSARSQWGSCTHDGRIRLNWRLVHFALPVIDYVVAHELAHLKELNHGPRFWSAVAQLLPGFEAARDQIRAVDLAALPG